MSKYTKIQWADGTANPTMGCDGCELWASTLQLIAAVEKVIANLSAIPTLPPRSLMRGLSPSDIYHQRALLARLIAPIGDYRLARKIENKIVEFLPCYAGQLHLRYGEDSTQPNKHFNPGYASKFEMVELFPGRMAAAARWSDLRGQARPGKPWADGLPRMIFVSDMSDALSADVPFDYLRREIINVVSSPRGSRHLWLWLTKRPARMAEFSQWLGEQSTAWPDNLVAMTSVTSQATVGRVAQLKRVNCRFKGLSVEPLFTPVHLPLAGIDWCIVGGASGTRAKPFDLAWARDIVVQCREAGTAPFIKQLGRHPVVNGALLKLKDTHGGNWDEWPADLRIREYPAAFAGKIVAPAKEKLDSAIKSTPNREEA